MKTRNNSIVKIFSIFLLFVFSFGFTHAQSSKQKEATEKKMVLKSLIDSKKYVFKAQSATPLRGSTRQLTPDYDVRIMGDSLVTYLPYFGRAYSAPINNSEGGIKLTSTNFDYKMVNKKKGGWEITLIPKDNADVRQMLLSISANGYAYLQVTNNNRDPISFNGYIEELKSKK